MRRGVQLVKHYFYLNYVQKEAKCQINKNTHKRNSKHTMTITTTQKMRRSPVPKNIQKYFSWHYDAHLANDIHHLVALIFLYNNILFTNVVLCNNINFFTSKFSKLIFSALACALLPCYAPFCRVNFFINCYLIHRSNACSYDFFLGRNDKIPLSSLDAFLCCGIIFFVLFFVVLVCPSAPIFLDLLDQKFFPSDILGLYCVEQILAGGGPLCNPPVVRTILGKRLIFAKITAYVSYL